MRILLVAPTMIWASTASAHPGHIELIAGHDHWVGGAAIGIAILIGLAGVIKGKAKPDDAVDGPQDDEVPA